MLSIARSTHAAWRPQFLNILSSGTDEDEDEVRQAFDDGIVWADAAGVPHKKPSGSHYAEQYLRTKAAGDPIIPRFMRAYCAHRLSLTCEEGRGRRPTNLPVQAARSTARPSEPPYHRPRPALMVT